jgi:beta-ureidopropionase / N-carbamoyl-L-amino-acid hydrolase
MSLLPPPDLGRVSRDFEVLSSYRDPGSPGWTRRVFSTIDREARERVAEMMAGSGLRVETDAAANLFGTLPGTGRLPGAIVTGSHTDTVAGGGRFDGIIGVLGAIEAVRCLRRARIRLDHDLIVADFLGEEPNDFGISCVGSRAVAGALGEEHLNLVDPDGRTLRQALSAAGGEPARLREARWEPGRLHCFVELHIEQGPRLAEAGVPIGVVTGIAGIERLLARFEGQADHAGTTPMGRRRDAFLGAAEAALAIERLAEGAVATAGRLEIRPGAHNVVPGEAELWAEARSDDDRWLAGFSQRVEAEVTAISARRRLSASVRWISREPPVPVTGWVADVAGRAAASLRLKSLALPSGAGHDAAHMARLGPMGMIFIPSRDGRSHCPEEWTDLEQVGQGIAVLAETIRLADHGERDHGEPAAGTEQGIRPAP